MLKKLREILEARYFSSGQSARFWHSRKVWVLRLRLLLVSWRSHVLRRIIRSRLQGETYNLQAWAEGGDMVRAAIAHIDNKLGEKQLFTTYDWESQSASAMRHLWLTCCDSTASSLYNTANPAGQDKRLNIEIRSLRQTLWRTLLEKGWIRQLKLGIGDKRR